MRKRVGGLVTKAAATMPGSDRSVNNSERQISAQCPAKAVLAKVAADGDEGYITWMSFDEQIAMFLGRSPRVAVSAFIAPGAFVAGDVTIGEEAGIWPGCSLRGDIAPSPSGLIPIFRMVLWFMSPMIYRRSLASGSPSGTRPSFTL